MCELISIRRALIGQRNYSRGAKSVQAQEEKPFLPLRRRFLLSFRKTGARKHIGHASRRWNARSPKLLLCEFSAFIVFDTKRHTTVYTSINLALDRRESVRNRCNGRRSRTQRNAIWNVALPFIIHDALSPILLSRFIMNEPTIGRFTIRTIFVWIKRGIRTERAVKKRQTQHFAGNVNKISHLNSRKVSRSKLSVGHQLLAVLHRRERQREREGDERRIFTV